MTDDAYIDHRTDRRTTTSRQGRPGRRPSSPIIRWSALATGSLVGIGTWALLYVLGATLWLATGGPQSEAGSALRAGLGLYGALSASCALAWAAHTAARTGGAHTVENALLYGMSLWSMSTITLLALSTCVTTGLLDGAIAQTAPIFAVGFAAIGLLPGVGTSSGATWQTMAAVVATLVLSLLIALWGGLRGRCRDR